MKRIAAILLFFVLIIYNAQAEDNNYLEVNSKDFISFTNKQTAPDNKLASSDNSQIFHINQNNAENIFLSKFQKLTINEFPISDMEFGTIHLNRVRSIIDANTQWLKGTKDGILPAEAIEIFSFEGTIKGEKDSKVFLNYSQGKLFGIIQRQNEEQFAVAPDIFHADKKNNLIPHILSVADFGEQSSDENIDFCGTADYTGDATEIYFGKDYNDKLQSSTLLQAPIAVEGEYYYYLLMREDYERAALYIANVMSLAARIYEENTNITFYIPYVLIHVDENSCLYDNRETLGEKLTVMPSVWRNRNVDRAIAVLFADLNRQPSGYRVAGISMGGTPYKGSLCSKNRGYCVFGIKGNYQYPTTNYTWDVSVTSHEMGHNFGCPHTHGCFWEQENKPLGMIDTCVTGEGAYPVGDACIRKGDPIPRPGTIMSYCHLTNGKRNVQLFFHERMKPLIRIASKKASCITEISDPTIKLLNPLGDVLLEAKKYEKIRWTSAHVSMVDIKYSIDAGESWETIASNINTSDSIYNWRLPRISSDDVLVLIHDSFDQSIADTSITTFSIHYPIVEVKTPSEDDKIGQMESFEIKWDKLLVESVYIVFSTDNGSNWKQIATKQERTYYSWDVPDIICSTCRIMVIDENDSQVKSMTGNFAIGGEKAEIIAPNGGETLRAGDIYKILWNSEYISKIWLQYSTDGGEVWRKVRPAAIDADYGSYDWKVPNSHSNNVMMRLSSYADINITIDLSDGPFNIDTSATGISDDIQPINSLLKIIEIVPNPLSNQALIKIEYNLPSVQPLELLLADETGSIVRKLYRNSSPNIGINTIKIEIPDIPQGNYFLIARTGSIQTSASVKILR